MELENILKAGVLLIAAIPFFIWLRAEGKKDKARFKRMEKEMAKTREKCG